MLLSAVVIIDFIRLFWAKLEKLELKIIQAKLIFFSIAHFCHLHVNLNSVQLKTEPQPPLRASCPGASCRCLVENRVGHKFTVHVC